MKNFIQPAFTLLLCLFFTSCKDSSEVLTTLPTPKDTAQYGTPFADVPATQDIVMYEVNLRAFSKEGNFAGVQARLDSIKSLGVNVIWLMPIFPVGTLKSVGQLGSPYSVKNYTEVNPEFGTLEDLRTLVQEAHTRRMAVILDWVANHTSWDNPWIANRSWYSQDTKGNIIIPPGTNWQDVADLNYSNQDMRQEMIRCMKYWVQKANIDGFRCDAADYVPFDFWKQALDTLKKLPNRKLILLAEGARSDHFTAGFQLNFSWDYFGRLKNVFKNSYSASQLETVHRAEYSAIPSGSHKLRFTSNHDECAWDDTPIGLFGGVRGSMSAFVLSSFVGGVPLLYNGQEVGCPVKLPFFSRSPIDWTINPALTEEYKKLLALRAAHSAVRTGTLDWFADNTVAVFRRKTNQDSVLVLVNTRNTSVSYVLPLAFRKTSWTNAMTSEAVQLDSVITLSGYEYRILH